MIPVGTSNSAQKSKVRRYPYIIVPVDPPSHPIPEGTTYMQALVFSLRRLPPDEILSGFCRTMGLDSARYTCTAVVFDRDLAREGKGRLSVRRDGDRYVMEIRWLDADKDGH